MPVNELDKRKGICEALVILKPTPLFLNTFSTFYMG